MRCRRCLTAAHPLVVQSTIRAAFAHLWQAIIWLGARYHLKNDRQRGVAIGRKYAPPKRAAGWDIPYRLRRQQLHMPCCAVTHCKPLSATHLVLSLGSPGESRPIVQPKPVGKNPAKCHVSVPKFRGGPQREWHPIQFVEHKKSQVRAPTVLRNEQSPSAGPNYARLRQL